MRWLSPARLRPAQGARRSAAEEGCGRCSAREEGWRDGEWTGRGKGKIPSPSKAPSWVCGVRVSPQNTHGRALLGARALNKRRRWGNPCSVSPLPFAFHRRERDGGGSPSFSRQSCRILPGRAPRTGERSAIQPRRPRCLLLGLGLRLGRGQASP